MSIRTLLCAAALALAAPAAAADAPARGPESNLPLPRFVTLHVDRANLRRGPGTAHRIDWVYQRRGYPLEVVAEYGLWRRVRDRDAAEGWMHHSMLRNWRGAAVIAPRATLRDDPAPDAAPVAVLETGVLGRLRACGPLWCEMQVDGARGWVRKAALWGVRPDETFD